LTGDVRRIYSDLSKTEITSFEVDEL